MKYVGIMYSPSCRSKPVRVSFLLLNIKEDILKNAGNQTVDGPHCLPQYFFPYFGNQWRPTTVLQNIFLVFNIRNKFIEVRSDMRVSNG